MNEVGTIGGICNCVFTEGKGFCGICKTISGTGYIGRKGSGVKELREPAWKEKLVSTAIKAGKT